ncbi:hypothetical protein J2786_003635 [Chryseobacterium vietnamense]|uniref:Uncharacterized protein n=1 Tax=Chryseobacterium vietnamense TaxID=866785 RepID=A0ACC6JBT3_9FLAO|nr:hypothetical protein [Chryseobacterium vietnamense]MDR6460501.1 hypothetical protein [Chryseobacterium vietnamense]
MKKSLKVLFLAMFLVLLNSCGAITTYDAPLEPGQTVYQRQDSQPRQTETRSENTNTIPEPGQIEMKRDNDNNNDNIPEPGQTEMKTNDNNNNVPEPGQTEMKVEEEQ